MKKSLAIFSLLSLFAVQIYAQASGAGAAHGGELTLRAFQKAYPDKISGVAFTGNDWTITVGRETFYWAGGRLLPKELLDKIDSYSPHMFYTIPAKPASPESLSPEYITGLRSRGSNEARLERRDSHRAFYSALYGGIERAEIEEKIERVDFLGFKVSVHRDIAAPLRQVDEEIRKLEGSKAFINSIGSIDGYSWRQIAGTQRMSYHSWGLAVDIQPRSLGGKAIYWLWERGRNEDWMLVPLDRRWSPPEPVIEIFEQAGFIWGGKWIFYDNMHFEYRPELHELGRLTAESSAAAGSGRELHHIYPDGIQGKR